MASDTTDRPRFTLFAGPNGAGKTTAYHRFLDAGYETGEYLNPDDIAGSLGADETAVEIKAGREVIRRTRSLIAARRPFVRETTLSGREILRSVSDARSSNYRVVMVFVGIRSWKTARSRVTFRVASGGHDIPRQDQERRLPRSLDNAGRVARIADVVYFLDNAGCSTGSWRRCGRVRSFFSTLRKPSGWSEPLPVCHERRRSFPATRRCRGCVKPRGCLTTSG